MPNSIDMAIRFLETQWSSINDNKLMETREKNH
jgi:hypothetical protein